MRTPISLLSLALLAAAPLWAQDGAAVDPNVPDVPGPSIQTETGRPQETGEEAQPEVSSETKEALEQSGEKEIPTPLSGLVLMPTAYRGFGADSVGVGLDINTAYYIGRLYGKNNLAWTLRKTDFIDRIGLWFIGVDGKMTVKSETKWSPAFAVGGQGYFVIRDSPQPTLATTAISVQVDDDKTQGLGGAYIAASKRPARNWIFNAGYMEGSVIDMISLLSEYITPEALQLSGQGNGATRATSRGMVFGGFMWLIKDSYPVAVEFMLPQGAPGRPKLVNFRLGQFLKLNFEVSYLTYDGGWDLLGMFHYRHAYFPRRKSSRFRD